MLKVSNYLADMSCSKSSKTNSKKEWKCPCFDGKSCKPIDSKLSRKCDTHNWFSENYCNDVILDYVNSFLHGDGIGCDCDPEVIKHLLNIFKNQDECKTNNALNKFNSYLFTQIDWTDIIHNLQDQELCKSILEYMKKGKIRISFECSLVDGCMGEYDYPKWKIDLLKPFIDKNLLDYHKAQEDADE